MDIVLYSAAFAAIGIGGYALWRTRKLGQELHDYWLSSQKALNEADTLVWQRTRSYIEQIDDKQKDVLKQAEEYRQHHDRLMQALEQEHNVSKGTIAKLTEYIDTTKKGLKEEIDSTFANYSGKVKELDDADRNIRENIRELRSKKADTEALNGVAAEVYEALEHEVRELNERLDKVSVHLNKATQDRLATGERAILEHLRLGLKQKDIATKLNTTEARVSKVKKKLQELGLLD